MYHIWINIYMGLFLCLYIFYYIILAYHLVQYVDNRKPLQPRVIVDGEISNWKSVLSWLPQDQC